MRIGIGVGAGLGSDGSMTELLDEYGRAEEAGFASAWTANIIGGLDALTVLALAGRVTSRIELGTGVVPTYPLHPVALAQQALTTAAATGGRLTLGIGLSHQVVIENMLGLDYSKPIRHMREYLSVLMPLLRGEGVRLQGEEYRVAAQVRAPGVGAPQVVVAALGPQMLKLAGRMADGTMTWMGGPAYLRDVAVPAIGAAARESGRAAPRVVAGLPIAVTARVAEAREEAAKTFEIYGRLPSYRATLDRGGYAGPADVAIVGSEAEVERAVAGLAEIGVTDFSASIFAVPGDAAAQARTWELLAGLARRG